MLQVSDLVTEFAVRAGVVHAVNGVSFEVGDGQLVGLVGESGCGKSASVRSIMGLVHPPGRVVDGSVRLNGRELLGLSRRELRTIRGAEIGFVGQNPFAALNPVLKIEAQFKNMARAHGRYAAAEVRERAHAKLTAVQMPGVERVLRGYAHELSGGMAQRVVIALATLLDPELLIADEPTTALDVTVQREILETLRELVVREGRSMLLVTHDLGVVAQYCDSVVVMYAGRVVERGPVRTVFRSPAHPYTQALLEAVPRAGKPLRQLRGSLPDPLDYPPGCPYAARCPRAAAPCATIFPEPRPTERGSDVSCHFPLEGA